MGAVEDCRIANSDGIHPTSQGCIDAFGRIFEDDAVRRLDPQGFRPFEKYLWMRLAYCGMIAINNRIKSVVEAYPL